MKRKSTALTAWLCLLALLSLAPLKVGATNGVITLTTEKGATATVRLALKSAEAVTIEGVSETTFDNTGRMTIYTLTGQTVTIKGNLTDLDLSAGSNEKNLFTGVEVTGNSALTYLNCSRNSLTELDLTGCTALKELYCQENQLTTLNHQDCLLLERLNLESNALTALNLSGKYHLTYVNVDYNNLQGAAMTSFMTQLPSRSGLSRGNLEVVASPGDLNHCLKSDVAIATAKNWYVNYAGLGAGKLTITTTRAIGESISISARADGNVRVEGGRYYDHGGRNSYAEAYRYDYKIQNSTLTIYGDVLAIDVSYANLSAVNTSRCPTLEKLGVWNNSLTAVDVSQNPNLKDLSINDNKLTTLSLAGHAALLNVSANNNELSSVDLSGCTALQSLHVSGNQLSALNLAPVPALTYLEANNNRLATLELSSNTALTELWLQNNQLATLNLSGLAALSKVSCLKNNLSELLLTGCTGLTDLGVNENKLTALTLPAAPNLRYLYVQKNLIKGAEMTNLMNGLPNRVGLGQGTVRVEDNEGYFPSNICLKTDVAIARAKNWNTNYSGIGSGKVTLTTTRALGERVHIALGANGNIAMEGAVTPDYYDNYLLTNQTVTLYGDVTGLYVYGSQLTDLDLSALTTLQELECYNNALTKLNLSTNPNLKRVSCYGNQIAELTLPEETNLTELSCYENKLTALDLSGYAKLTTLYCRNNALTELNLTGCAALSDVSCRNNALTSLTLTGCAALKSLICQENALTALDLSDSPILEEVSCNNNKLTTLSLAGKDKLRALYCQYNLLTSLSVDGCFALNTLYCYENRINGEAMTQLMTDLPDRAHEGRGYLRLINPEDSHSATEQNRAFRTDIAMATEKNWDTYGYKGIGTGKVTLTTAKPKNSIVRLATNQEGNVLVQGALYKSDGNYIVQDQTITIMGDLTSLSCYDDKLTYLDLSLCPTLTTLECYTNELGELDLSYNKELTRVVCYNNKLTSLNLTGLTKLTTLRCGNNQLAQLDLSALAALTSLECQTNQLSALSFKGNPYLQRVLCYENQIKGAEMTAMAESLPDRTGQSTGEICLIYPDSEQESNVCLKSDVAVIGARNWSTYYRTDDYDWYKYSGSEQTYAVTLTTTGSGTASVLGFNDLSVVPKGTTLTVEANPAEGWSLASIIAGGVDITASKSFEVSANTSVEVTFTQQTFAVTTTQTGSGKVLVEGYPNLKAVPYGTTLTVKATPAQGYTLVALTANGKDILGNPTLTVKAATEINAQFDAQTFAVTTTQTGQGTITVTGAEDLTAVPYGTELTVTATPAEGWTRTSLTAGGEDISSTRRFTVTQDTEVKAVFTANTYRITTVVEGEGELLVEGAQTLEAEPYGSTINVTARPAYGYELIRLTANGEDILAQMSFVVAQDTEVKAVFAKKTYKVTLTSNEHGTISVTPEVDLNAVPHGTTLTVVAKGNNDNCVLTKLTAGGVDILSTKTFTVTEPIEVVAEFVDHTAADRIEAGQIRLYPNPAQDYLRVEGLAPFTQVALYAFSGELIYRLQANETGCARFDLSALGSGTYLVTTSTQTFKVVKE